MYISLGGVMDPCSIDTGMPDKRKASYLKCLGAQETSVCCILGKSSTAALLICVGHTHFFEATRIVTVG
jgi:hypothetical protein